MKEQIEILTSEVTKLKHNNSNKEQQSISKNYRETEPETIGSPPSMSLQQMYQILPRKGTIFYSQTSKNLQDASAVSKSLTKSELKEVINIIHNIMLMLTVFEKCFSEK